MVPVHPKKVAAAVAAVLQCAAEAEAALSALSPAASLSPRSLSAGPFALPPLWGWAGRQDAMRDRILWQRRMSKSW
jgi:hypothetical protein